MKSFQFSSISGSFVGIGTILMSATAYVFLTESNTKFCLSQLHSYLVGSVEHIFEFLFFPDCICSQNIILFIGSPVYVSH